MELIFHQCRVVSVSEGDIYVYLPIRRTRINILCPSSFCRAKMTPDKSAKDAVSPIRHDTAVLGMGFESWFGIMGISKHTGMQC